MFQRCFIVGAGEFCGSYYPSDVDYIIAADGGYSRLVSKGIMPDLVIGDFDSIGAVPDHPNIMRFPQEKDDTDMMLAVLHGFSKGLKTFIIDGGLGGMPDHTFANMQVLAHIAKSDARGFLLGNDMTVTAICNGSAVFSSRAKGRISIFCAGDKAAGVSLDGLKYRLGDALLTNTQPLGISNEFIGEQAAVTVRDGTLIIMWTGGIEDFYDMHHGSDF